MPGDIFSLHNVHFLNLFILPLPHALDHAHVIAFNRLVNPHTITHETKQIQIFFPATTTNILLLPNMEVFQPHNTKRNTNQHWNNFVKWWEARKQSIVSENILDGDVFPDVSLAELLQDIQTVMLSAAHLQRGHLALYVTKLKPKIKNLTHLDGGSIKNYVDGICRKLKECESKSTELAERYGSWSVWTHHHYSKLHEKTAIKVYQEDKENRGKKVT